MVELVETMQTTAGGQRLAAYGPARMRQLSPELQVKNRTLTADGLGLAAYSLRHEEKMRDVRENRGQPLITRHANIE